MYFPAAHFSTFRPAGMEISKRKAFNLERHGQLKWPVNPIGTMIHHDAGWSHHNASFSPAWHWYWTQHGLPQYSISPWLFFLFILFPLHNMEYINTLLKDSSNLENEPREEQCVGVSRLEHNLFPSSSPKCDPSDRGWERLQVHNPMPHQINHFLPW